MSPRLVHVDDDLLVVHKPFGVPTQPGRDRGGEDLAAWVGARWADAALQHRLDQAASGLVVFARSPRARRSVTEGLRRHAVERRYLAVLAGDPEAWGGEARWSWPVEGAAAVSHARLLGAASGMLAVRLSLETGRHHQLRRHAARAGTPIVGDRRYGGDVGGWHPRLALHGAWLRLRHPGSGAWTTWEDPLPDDLVALWQAAGGPTPPPSGLPAA